MTKTLITAPRPKKTLFTTARNKTAERGYGSAWQKAAASVREALRSNDPAAHLRGDPVQPVFQVRAEQ